MKNTSRSLATAVALLSFTLPVMAQAQRKTDATTILNNMSRVYSRLTSYQDEGVLVTTNDEPTGGTIEKMPFKSFFKRPNLLRFEWTEYTITKLGRKNVVWSNGKEAFMYWEPDEYEKRESLDMAVAGATGISRGTVNTVSTMMWPDEFGSSLLERLVKPSLVGEDVLEGVRCFHIKATDGADPIELWVGKNDFLLRKLRQETKDSDRITIKEEIRRNIQPDHLIPEVVFNYQPPIPLTARKETDVEAARKLLDPGPLVWSEFRSEEGRFSVLLPDKPTSQASTVEMSQGRFEQHTFIASHLPLLCTIAYTDFPKQLLVANDVDGLFDGVRDEVIRGVGGKLASENKLLLDGYAGREIKVHMFRGELRLRLYLVGDRLYVLSFLNAEKAFASDEEPNKFFASFKLQSTVKSIAARQAPSPDLKRLK